MLFFVIKVITHSQLGSCSLPSKDNIDLLTQPLYRPAHHVYILFSTKELFCCCAWRWLQAHGATHTTAARSCFPARERPASNRSWALQHGLRATVLQTHGLPLLGSRASPSWACWKQPHTQPAREPEWGSGSDRGPLSWPDRRVMLSLRTPDTSQNESSCMCSPQIWDQGLQWKAHHSNLPKDFGYHERLNSGSLSGVTTTLILITPAKWKKNFSPILYVKIPVWGHLVWFIFLQNFIILMWSYTLSVPSCYHADFYNNWNFLH